MNNDEYLALSTARAQEAKALMIKALDGQLPAGYALSDDPGQMFGNALFRIKPEHVVEGSRSIHFFHSLNYKSQKMDGEMMITPTTETVHVSCDTHNGHSWNTDVEWGVDGKIKYTLFSNEDLIASVRDVVSASLTQKPFTEFEWKRDEHDSSKYRIYGGGDKSSLGAVWKSGNGMWGSTLGIHYETLGKAKVAVEGAAIGMIRSRHDERLAGLGDVEQPSQTESGKWYVQSGYDGHVYSGPYDTEKEAQCEIDTDPEQAGGVPCHVEDPELSISLNVDKFTGYVHDFAAEHQFSVSDEEIGEVMGGRDMCPVAGTLEGKVLALGEFDDVGVVFQSKGRGEARVFLADTLSRVPAVGEMMKVEWKDGKGVVLPLVAEKVLGR